MATTKSSRYRNTKGFYQPDGLQDWFSGLRPRKIGVATGVLEHIVRDGDRLDLLALHYYNDDRHWWRIVDANPEVIYGSDLVIKGREGSVILIPRAYEPGSNK